MSIHFKQLSLPSNTNKLAVALEALGWKAEVVAGTSVLLFEKNQIHQTLIDQKVSLLPYNLGVILSNRWLVTSLLTNQRLIKQRNWVSFIHRPRKKLPKKLTTIHYPVTIESEEGTDRRRFMAHDHTQLALKLKLFRYQRVIIRQINVPLNTYHIYYDLDQYLGVSAYSSHPILLKTSGTSVSRNKPQSPNLPQIRKLAEKVLGTFPGLRFVTFTLNLTPDSIQTSDIREVSGDLPRNLDQEVYSKDKTSADTVLNRIILMLSQKP